MSEPSKRRRLGRLIAVIGALMALIGSISLWMAPDEVVLGVALGFAFKDILENYLAGILLSLRQPFAQRDHVVIDGNEGVVVALTSRATILMTPDGNHLRLPNALVFRGVMLNYTRNPGRRFEFDVGVGVNEDLVAAQRLGLEALAGLDGLLAKPPPRAFINALGDSSVQLRFQGWVDQRTHEFVLVRSEAIRTVKLALEAAGMDMPEPIYRVQITERDAGATAARAPGAAAARAPDDAGVEAKADAPPQSAQAGVDTRAHADLQEQIQQDERSHASADLLDPSAPKE